MTPADTASPSRRPAKRFNRRARWRCPTPTHKEHPPRGYVSTSSLDDGSSESVIFARSFG
jgi:hypothetical protein